MIDYPSSVVRVAPVRILLCWLLVFATVFGSATVSAQRETELPACDDGTLRAVLAKHKHEIADIQSQLESLGFDPHGVDGIEGENTRSALRAFCRIHGRAGRDLIEILHQEWAAGQQGAPHLRYFQLTAGDLESALARNAEQSDALQQAKGFFATQYTEELVLRVDKTRVLRKLADTRPAFLGQQEYGLLEKAVKDKTINDQQVKQPDERAAIFTALTDINTGEKEALKALQAFPATAFPGQDKFTQKLKLLDGFEEKSGDYVDTIVALAAKTVADNIDQLSQPIHWSGGDCGCVPNTGDSEIYGLYPYWLAAEAHEKDIAQTHAGAPAENANVTSGVLNQTLDFSNLTSVGYFVFSLDGDGEVLFDDENRPDNAQRFAATAHRHSSKTDWVVSADGWTKWDEIDGIVEKLAEALPQREDAGLTVYFPGYGPGPGQLASLPDLICAMATGSTLQPARLNVMLTSDVFVDLLRSTHSCESGGDIRNLLAGEDAGGIDSILVLLPEPTTDTKKNLRQVVEASFHGLQRRRLLRKIIPIVSPIGNYIGDNNPRNQFVDDLIYFQDNFRGVGYWPMPTSRQPEFQTVKDRTLEVFEHREGEDILDRLVRRYLPELCAYACPNRWILRYTFDAFVLVLVLLGAVSLWNCNVKEFLVRRSRWMAVVIAVAALILLVMLICDPFWNERSTEVVLLLTIAAVLFVSIRRIRKQIRGALP